MKRVFLFTLPKFDSSLFLYLNSFLNNKKYIALFSWYLHFQFNLARVQLCQKGFPLMLAPLYMESLLKKSINIIRYSFSRSFHLQSMFVFICVSVTHYMLGFYEERYFESGIFESGIIQDK